jgi:molybdenum cofactor biosynthesis enzyme MoaA
VVFVAVFVAVVVVAPGAVAALGSGNDRVGVIKPVSEDATCAQCDR